MKCEEIQSLLIEYIDGNLDDDTIREIVRHLESCDACRKEFEEDKKIFNTIAGHQLELPDESLRVNFNAMLQKEIEKLKVADTIKEIPIHKILNEKWSSGWMRIAAAVVILIAGVWIGTLIRSGSDNTRTQQLSELKNEMKDMKEILMLTMLNGESASQRIKAVNFSSEIPYPNQKVINALISTLNNDKNVNVRMAAAYSLEKFWEIPAVRDSLVTSLDNQTDPIIQIVLINILTEKKESKAIRPMQEIITNKNTMQQVKDIAEKSVRVLM
jgi:hypothetical protein